MLTPDIEAKRRDPEHLAKVIRMTEQLIELELQKIETMRQLVKALRLATITPEVWKGVLTTKIDGRTVWSYLVGGELPTKDTDFVVLSNGEEVARQRLFETHTSLWPKDMLERSLKGMYRETVKKIVEREKEASDVPA
jgi:hypothetical protein